MIMNLLQKKRKPEVHVRMYACIHRLVTFLIIFGVLCKERTLDSESQLSSLPLPGKANMMASPDPASGFHCH